MMKPHAHTVWLAVHSLVLLHLVLQQHFPRGANTHRYLLEPDSATLEAQVVSLREEMQADRQATGGEIAALRAQVEELTLAAQPVEKPRAKAERNATKHTTRRRAQAVPACDLAAQTAAAMDACCPATAGGGGHRRTQASCNLPDDIIHGGVVGDNRAEKWGNGLTIAGTVLDFVPGMEWLGTGLNAVGAYESLKGESDASDVQAQQNQERMKQITKPSPAVHSWSQMGLVSSMAPDAVHSMGAVSHF